MDDDVIRGAVVTHAGAITYPPPPPKIQAIAKQAPKKAVEETAVARAAREAAEAREAGQRQILLLVVGAIILMLIGLVAPPSFLQHLVVFALSCFVGYHVIWNVSHALHTPLMAVTNAVSSIIILGALLQFGSSSWIVSILAGLSILMASVNIFGGFLVTRRMLKMFQKS